MKRLIPLVCTMMSVCALAGGFQIRNHSFMPLFEAKDYIEMSLTHVHNRVGAQEIHNTPNPSTPAKIKDVLESFTTVELVGRVSTPFPAINLMSQYYEPYLSVIHYPTQWPGVTGKLRSEALFLALSSHVYQGFSVAVGNELFRFKNGLLNLGYLQGPTGSVPLGTQKVTDNTTRTRQSLAVAYQYDPIALRVGLSASFPRAYAIKTQEQSNFFTGPATGILPRIFTFDAESGIAPNTLLSLSIAHQRWKPAQLHLFKTPIAKYLLGDTEKSAISSFSNDTDYTLALTHRPYRNWAFTAGVHLEPKTANTGTSLLSQRDGERTFGIAATYIVDQGRVTTKLARKLFGNRTVTPTAAPTSSWDHSNNHASISQITGRYFIED